MKKKTPLEWLQHLTDRQEKDMNYSYGDVPAEVKEILTACKCVGVNCLVTKYGKALLTKNKY